MEKESEAKRRFAVDGIRNTGFFYTKTLLEGKYKLPILYCLQLDGPTRYNELLRRMETATNRSLTRALKELEADGLVSRKDYGEIPPRVEYSLSERGRTLEPVLDAFCNWGQDHRDD
ncbi:winged helix-turn-helix transcriptional regulator [Rubneribacter sp.]|nr:winged helix-turn-helix transcriptional regulator [Candidatus Rubneribacter avistercoris]